MDEFDVIVIGAGPPGEVAAGRCADGGLSVAIVEERLIGGECSFYGCIPSKTLIRPGDVVAAARRAPGAAEAVSGPVDVAAALRQRDHMTSSWDDSGQVPWLADKGITIVRGHGRLAGAKSVEVQSRDGDHRHLTARKAVILASGTTPNIPNIDGIHEVSPWDNRAATAAQQIPESLIVLGGGAVGAELAQAFKRLGSKRVTVVEGGPRLLSKEEPFAGEEVAAAFADEGIEVFTGVHCPAVAREKGGPVIASLDNGQEVSGAEILVAVGRRPNTGGLGLESVGLTGGDYIKVDRRLRVAGPDGGWLYAVGDCNGLALLTHMGKYQASIAADVILGKDAEDVADYGMVPRVTFTDPQVAAVGLTEKEAADEGLQVQAVQYPVGDVPGAYTQGNGIKGTAKLVIDERRSVIVGATFTGPGVQELLHSATVAVVGEVPIDRLQHAVPSFPTLGEVWLHLLEAAE